MKKIKSINKVIIIALLLTMLLLPFSSFLKVKAETVTITTDDTKTMKNNSNFEYVKNTTNLYLQNVESDTFSAYKVLDTYYNKSTNEISYDFTENFQSFINQLDSSDEFSNYTVQNYQQLTSDDVSNTIETSSKVNKLVSKYATYIKTNGAITGISFTNENSEMIIKDIEVGSYLILPSEVNSRFTYGVMIANAVFNVENSSWILNECKISVKSVENNLLSVVATESDGQWQESITYIAGEKTYYGGNVALERQTVPTNTHSSIVNNAEVMKMLGTTEVTFPTGITYNPDNIFLADRKDDRKKVEIKDNALYFTIDGTEYKYADVIIGENPNKITLFNVDWHNIVNDRVLVLELILDNNITTGSSATNVSGNRITTTGYYLKDPYVDIGINPTSVDIDKALEKISMINIIYAYGVTVTNKTGSNTLNGAKFQVCLDKECTNKVGEEFEITENGTYTFKGINDTDTYYLKQVKAPTGYKLLNEVVELNPESLNKEAGLYNIEVENTKIGLLPTTGGLGTILYTTFGLLIIVVGSIAFISYRKKQVNN